MDSKNRQKVDSFVGMVVDCRDSGIRIFNAWLEKNPALIKKTDPEFYDCLKSLTDLEIEKINIILPMVLKTSFYSLFEALELGKDGVEFELSMKDQGVDGETFLVCDSEDFEIRNEIDVR